MVSRIVVPRFGQQPDQVPKTQSRFGIESRGRFVEEKQLRKVDDAESDIEAATLSPGQRADLRLSHRAEPDEFEHFLGDTGRPIAFREHRHSFRDCQHPGVADFLKHNADLGAPASARRSGVFAQHTDTSGITFTVTLEDLDRCRLAGPVGPEDREYFSVLDIEVHIVHGL